MKIVILGGSGFLGSWVVRALVAGGHEVTVPLRSPDPWRLSGVHANRVELAGEDDLQRVVRESGADALVSLDWAGVIGPERDRDSQQLNADRLERTILSAVDSGIPRIVVAGSQAELGPQEGVATAESPPAPATAYGRAKVRALDVLRQHAENGGAGWHWGRVFSVFGAMDHPTTLLSMLAAAGARHEAIGVSAGRKPWSYLDAEDAATAFVLLATGRCPSGIVNVASPSAPPLRHSIEVFTAALATAPSISFGTEDNMRLEADVTPLTTAGWRPAVQVDDQLRRAAAWYSGRPVADPFLTGAMLPEPATTTS
ncbi:MAG: NAD(P)-dependent oxidoreductase [Pseudolysinimonas sp.]